MDIQAHFEEWSRLPSETVKMAISTVHPSVHATLVRLVSGPGQGGNPEGRVVDFSSVLDKTILGRIQTTAVGAIPFFDGIVACCIAREMQTGT